jgi:cytochrome c-type biogenesis protein CcmE
MTPRRRRMLWIGLLLLGIGLAVFLGLRAFQKNLLYFYTPSQIASGEAPHGYSFRVGGLVVKGSVKRGDGVKVTFDLTDGPALIGVSYEGILPDLFREGQGIIAIGQLDANGVFVASEVLAKHDENYMPPEVGEALKKNGQLEPNFKDYRK